MSPLALRLDGVWLHVQWPDGEVRLRAQRLRERCRCAACEVARRRPVGEAPVAATPLDLQLVAASPVGGYGVQLHFSDGHERGVYPWPYLRAIGQEG